MADPTFKKIELVGTSSESFSAAAANAIAKAKVPMRMIGLKILSFSHNNVCKMTVATGKSISKISGACVINHWAVSAGMKDTPFTPFTRMK